MPRKLTAKGMDYWHERHGFLWTVRYFDSGQWHRAYRGWKGELIHEAVLLGPGLDYRPCDPGVEQAFMSKFLKKALAAVSNGKGPGKGPPEQWLTDFPALLEFMTLRKLDNGQIRTPCSLTLSADENVHRGCLREVDEGLMLWATSGSLQGVLEALEAQLASDAPDWRTDRFNKGGKGKKKA